MNEHSKFYERVKNLYDSGTLTVEGVRNLVPKLITAEEFTEITGEPYAA